jgi:Protein of unknown function (DUF2975)
MNHPPAAGHPLATTLRLHRVQRTSRWMVRACWALTLTLPLALAVYWWLASDAELVALVNLPPSALLAPLLPWQRLAGAMVMGVPLLCLLWGLGHARRCFAQFARGDVFTEGATAHLRHMAAWVAAAALAALLAAAGVSVLLTLHQPPGARHVALAIGSDQLFTLFFAGLVWLMAAVIGQGQALAEENQAFV